jgi:MscS family membrane protein
MPCIKKMQILNESRKPIILYLNFTRWNFLDKIFGNNSLRDYAIVAGIILVTLILKRLLSRYIASLLFKIVNRIWKNVDKKSFNVDLVVEPLEWFLLILIVPSFHLTNSIFRPIGIIIFTVIQRKVLSTASALGISIAAFTWLAMRMIDFIAIVLEQKSQSYQR